MTRNSGKPSSTPAKTKRANRDARTGQWVLQDAKARFSELVRRAYTDGPQHVTVHGRQEVVVLSAEGGQLAVIICELSAENKGFSQNTKDVPLDEMLFDCYTQLILVAERRHIFWLSPDRLRVSSSTSDCRLSVDSLSRFS